MEKATRTLPSDEQVEKMLSYRPPLREPLALVSSVLLVLPASVAPTPALAGRWRLLVAALCALGLLLTLVPDTYLFNLLLAALGDLRGTGGNVGQGISDWIASPSVGSGSITQELITQHPLVLLGLCVLVVGLLGLLYQALSSPLPRQAADRRLAQ